MGRLVDHTMKERNELHSALEELKRLTGLSLEIKEQSPEELSHALSELKLLISAYQESNNKNLIYKKWITGAMELPELYRTAKRFHVKRDAFRGLFLMESCKEMDENAISILTHAFPDTANVWQIPMDPCHFAMVFTFPKKVSDQKLRDTSFLIMDIFNTEALMRVKVAFSSVINQLKDLSIAYQQAGLSLHAGKIFYPDQNIYPYNGLGIGRLLYGLSKEQCIIYMKETIGENYNSVLQPETAHTFNCFFDNNMNIAQTARQLHMHRNTLIYRLEQVQRETGLDVRQFHDAMSFRTALLVMNYLHSDTETK